MREIEGIQPYSEWHRSQSRMCVDMEQEYANVNNWTTGVKEYSLTGRVRIVIEGERELVTELLGKNFLRRKTEINKRCCQLRLGSSAKVGPAP